MNSAMMAEIAAKKEKGLKKTVTNDRSAVRNEAAPPGSFKLDMAAMLPPEEEETQMGDTMGIFRSALGEALQAKQGTPRGRVGIFERYDSALGVTRRELSKFC